MSTLPETPLPDGAAADRPAVPGTHVAVKSWENEGGYFPSLPGLSMVSAAVPSSVPSGASENPARPAMRAKFLADFAGGTIGQRHTTYQHGSRLLRRVAADRPR